MRPSPIFGLGSLPITVFYTDFPGVLQTLQQGFYLFERDTMKSVCEAVGIAFYSWRVWFTGASGRVVDGASI